MSGRAGGRALNKHFKTASKLFGHMASAQAQTWWAVALHVARIGVWQAGSQPGARTGARRCATFAGASEAALKLHTCSGCRRARYCGPRCQREAWGAHRAACKRRQALMG